MHPRSRSMRTEARGIRKSATGGSAEARAPPA
jgi:hypothetical protein